MLRDLMIRNILLVERLDLEFQAGLNVLTGETGAGKSILLDCLGFVLGRRGPADIVRSGADTGEVTAIFDMAENTTVAATLERMDLPINEELMIRRVISGGRKKAFVNDRPVSTDTLRALGDELLEIHGQHDDKGLLDTRSHVTFLDEFAGAETARDMVAKTWETWRLAAKALAEAEAARDAALKDAEFIEHSLQELDAFDPHEGDDAALDAERRMLKASEAIKDDVAAALAAVSGENGQAALLVALRRLGKVAEAAEGHLDAPIASLERAINDVAEAETGISSALNLLSGDPNRLEVVEDRLFGLRALARKHGVQPDALASLTQHFRAQFESIGGNDTALSDLTAKASQAQDAFTKAAAKLSKMRKHAAGGLNAAVMGELAALKMERAVFETVIEDADPGPGGTDRVSFRVATNPGAPAGHLAKIASGGELSRFLLALKVCLKGSGARTMIFDEIDRGVGGATADAVGRRLASIAAHDQVIVVTHSPQVAARGGHHWKVAKRVVGEATHSDVLPLDQPARVEELARMLAGETISEEAKSAAKVLLAG